jgi:hypothetical protein
MLGRCCFVPAVLAATTRFELVSFVYKTSALEPVELRRKIGGLGGSQTLTRSLQDFYALGYITSPG